MVLARSSMVAMAVVAGLALGACGDDAKNDDTAAVSSATTPAAATPTTTTDAPGAGEDVSEAGETLALGKRAVVPYVVYGKSGASQNTRLGVTVLRVRKGRIADFKDFRLDAAQKKTVPYYVDVTYENLGELKLQRFLMDPSIEDTDGQEYKPLNLIILSGTFKKCPEPSKARLRPGQRFTLCAPILLPRGKTYERVVFQGDATKDPYFWK
jgi:hypothetical protein